MLEVINVVPSGLNDLDSVHVSPSGQVAIVVVVTPVVAFTLMEHSVWFCNKK